MNELSERYLEDFAVGQTFVPGGSSEVLLYDPV
jgi:hypothetical protein